jgi:mannose-1-phosphate guanylyltransferase
LHVARRDRNGIIAMLPADHHIGRPEAFRAALRAAALLAERGDIATIGIRPSRPETGYGYLKVGARLPAQKGGGRSARAFGVERFVEKPDAVTARRYLAEEGYLWNSGVFVFRADVILDEIGRAMPMLRKKLAAIDSDLGTARYVRTLKRVFPECPSISIDYGVMEKSRRIVVVPAEFGWSDVGNFAALPEVRKADSFGNVTDGDVIAIAAKNNVVLAGTKRPVVVIGADDLVVVDAGDAVLVCRRDRAQDVRKAVDELERRGRRDLL